MIKKILSHPVAFLHVSLLRIQSKLFNTSLFKYWFAKRYSAHINLKINEAFGDGLLTDNNKKTNIENADRLLTGQYCLFSYVIKSVSILPNWHKDYITNYEYPLIRSHKIKTDSENRSDVKCVWEINRLQFLYTIASAYHSTKDTKYYNYYRAVIIDWIEKNPIGFGPNWKNAMEASIRAVNIYLSLTYFKDILKSDSFLSEKVAKSLYGHGLFIYYNREIGITGYKSNHFLSDILGLLVLGNATYDFRLGNKWFKYAAREFEIAMNEQVYDEGINYEHSISYHRFVSEIFLVAYWVNKNTSLQFSTRYVEKLKKMLLFTQYYVDPKGNAVQLGDSDDGRIIIFSDYFDWNKLDHSYLVMIGAKILKANDLSFKKTTNSFNKSIIYEKPGIFCLNDNGNYLFVAAWSVGTLGIGNHQHNDVLSYVLNIGSESFIVDPGTFNYTAYPELRNLFRSTSYHNTIRIDGEEINPFEKKILFRMHDCAKPKILNYSENNEFVVFEAEHYGYNRLSNKITHRRKFVYTKQSKQFEINDILYGSGSHLLEAFLHLDCDVVPTLDKNKVHLKKNNTIVCIELENEDLRFDLEKGYVSKSYLRKEECYILKLNLNFDSKINVNYKIYNEN